MNIKELAKAAQKNGICAPGMGRILRAQDKEDLTRYMIEGLDFCLDNNFPSVQYLEENGKGIIEKHGIHVNEACTLINRPLSVLLGHCEAIINIGEYEVADIFVKHTSKVSLSCTDQSFLRIDCFDDSEVTIMASGDAKVMVYVYGRAKVNYAKQDKAQVKVINKGKEKY